MQPGMRNIAMKGGFEQPSKGGYQKVERVVPGREIDITPETDTEIFLHALPVRQAKNPAELYHFKPGAPESHLHTPGLTIKQQSEKAQKEAQRNMPKNWLTPQPRAPQGSIWMSSYKVRDIETVHKPCVTPGSADLCTPAHTHTRARARTFTCSALLRTAPPRTTPPHCSTARRLADSTDRSSPLAARTLAARREFAGWHRRQQGDPQGEAGIVDGNPQTLGVPPTHTSIWKPSVPPTRLRGCTQRKLLQGLETRGRLPGGVPACRLRSQAARPCLLPWTSRMLPAPCSSCMLPALAPLARSTRIP